MILNKHKKIILYALLCVYSFALLKPIMPLANDVIAHTFYKMQHIATVHYENGKYHLHDELAENADQQKAESKGIPKSAVDETLTNHITNEIEKLKIYSPYSSSVIWPEIQFPADVNIKNPTPPPQA